MGLRLEEMAWASGRAARRARKGEGSISGGSCAALRKRGKEC
jgi:hypothetical protein